MSGSARCPSPPIWRRPLVTPRTAFLLRKLIALYWKGNMAAFEKDKGLIEELDNARATYLIDGRAPEEGEIFCNPDLAHTLTLIAEQGHADERRNLIDLGRDNPDFGPGDPRLHDGDTIYLTTADKDGMMVSLIQSNYRGMGSGLVADHLGFIFRDRGELFSLNPEDANIYAPGKRPFQTIILGFVTKDDQTFLSFGLMGGDMQPPGHVQVLTDIMDFGMNVQEAGDAARSRHSYSRAAAVSFNMPGTILQPCFSSSDFTARSKPDSISTVPTPVEGFLSEVDAEPLTTLRQSINRIRTHGRRAALHQNYPRNQATSPSDIEVYACLIHSVR
jgi:hypothetical protein